MLVTFVCVIIGLWLDFAITPTAVIDPIFLLPGIRLQQWLGNEGVLPLFFSDTIYVMLVANILGWTALVHVAWEVTLRHRRESRWLADAVPGFVFLSLVVLTQPK